MARKRNRKSSAKSSWTKLGSARKPVNQVAARVLGDPEHRPRHEVLLEKAKRIKSGAKREALMAEARAARSDYEKRMTSKSAESRARRALERAKWERNGPKW